MIALVTAWTWWTAARIDLRRLAEPPVVYAAARAVEPGVSVTTADLAGTLERLGYQHASEEPRTPGEFRRGADRWDIFLRAKADPQSARPALRVRLDVEH